MHPLLIILIILGGAIGVSWLVLGVYGLVRKKTKTEPQRHSRFKMTEDGSGGGEGGGDH